MTGFDAAGGESGLEWGERMCEGREAGLEAGFEDVGLMSGVLTDRVCWVRRRGRMDGWTMKVG